MEYISLHGYIRNVPSDTEVHAEHQLRTDRSTWPEEKKIYNHAKLGRAKKQEAKTGMLVGLDLPSVWRGGRMEMKQESDPHKVGNWVRAETFKAESKPADLW